MGRASCLWTCPSRAAATTKGHYTVTATTATSSIAKQGIDDFIVRQGPEAFRELVARATAPEPKPISLARYRGELIERRIQSIDEPGVYLDTSPTGSGKSFADTVAAKAACKSLTVLTTHDNCEEVEVEYLGHGLRASAYPPLCEETCAKFGEAERVMAYGLSPAKTLCPDCEYSASCEYQTGMKYTESMPHRIATHARAKYGLRELADGSFYVTLHEDSRETLRPTAEVAKGFDDVAHVAHVAAGKVWNKTDMTVRHYLTRMQDSAHALAAHLRDAETTARIDIPSPAGGVPQIDILLYRSIQSSNVHPNGAAMRLCRDIADGRVHELTVRVDTVCRRGGDQEVRRSIVAVSQTQLPEGVPVWINDATADPDEYRSLTGCPIVHYGADAPIEQKHGITQVPIDATKGTAPATACKILRAVLARYPEAQRVGVMCHREHVAAIRGTARGGAVLDGVTRSRIAMVEYFRGGQCRGSNSWLDCDLLIVLGTPRVPQSVIRTRLIAAGNVEVAAREPKWERDYWSGVDRDGRRHTVRSLAYTDHDWHQAHRAVVAAELIQAAGRGRGICDNGIPVVVVTTEELGFPLAGWEPRPIDDTMHESLVAIGELTRMFPTGESFKS